MTIYLYKKTHNITGLKYLGKTTGDPIKYKGSGKKWIRHLQKYGYDVKTEILKICETNAEIKMWGFFYSKIWNIVEDKSWANLKIEEGDGGKLPETFWIEKYKVSNPSQLDSVKLRKQDTTLKNYGVCHNSQSEEIKSKKKMTTRKSLGVDNPSQAEIIKIKKKETLLRNYGVEHTFHDTSISEKIKNTILEKYGVDNAFKSEEVRAKYRDNMLIKYGVTNPGQLPHVKEAARIRFQNSPILTCPHCGKQGKNKPNMMRHHFTRCKFNGN